MTKKYVPIWSKKAQKKLIDTGMSKKALAEEIKVNYNQLINVMSGRVINERIENLVCERLEIRR